MPSERDVLAVEGEDAAVADRDAVCVGGEVREYLRGAAIAEESARPARVRPASRAGRFLV
jgi:hypothetical protein